MGLSRVKCSLWHVLYDEGHFLLFLLPYPHSYLILHLELLFLSGAFHCSLEHWKFFAGSQRDQDICAAVRDKEALPLAPGCVYKQYIFMALRFPYL